MCREIKERAFIRLLYQARNTDIGHFLALTYLQKQLVIIGKREMALGECLIGMSKGARKV
jgi:hypothetical protein